MRMFAYADAARQSMRCGFETTVREKARQEIHASYSLPT